MEIKIKHSFNELYQLEIDEKGNMGLGICKHVTTCRIKNVLNIGFIII